MVGCNVAVMEKRFELKNRRFSFENEIQKCSCVLENNLLIVLLKRQGATVRMCCSNADNFKTT